MDGLLISTEYQRQRSHGVGSLCRRCGQPIEGVPYVSKYGKVSARYYHVECAEAVNLPYRTHERNLILIPKEG